MKPREEWKDIEGFEGMYQVSNLGRVKSLSRYKKGRLTLEGEFGISPVKERILKPNQLKGGYLQVTLTKNSRPYWRKIHRLVAAAFLDSLAGKLYVNHIDGVKSNNFVNNLEYCTMAENNAHAGRMNLKPIGTNHFNSKITHTDLKEIRELVLEGKTKVKDIAKRYKVDRHTITNITSGRTYSKEPT